MKKYLSTISLIALGLFGLASCDPETDANAGGTAVQDMAGEWTVQVDVVDEDGNVLYEDPYGLGTFNINTYNTAANDPDSMWVYDDSFYGVQMKVGVSYAASSKSGEAAFTAAAGTAYDLKGTGHVELLNGKVLYGVGKNVNGMPCDSIVMNVKFDDDDYGFIYRYSGVRYYGF